MNPLLSLFLQFTPTTGSVKLEFWIKGLDDISRSNEDSLVKLKPREKSIAYLFSAGSNGRSLQSLRTSLFRVLTPFCPCVEKRVFG